MVLWVAGSGGACASGEGTAGEGRETPAGSGAPGIPPSSGVAAQGPSPDAPPPEWLPPGYTEISWEEAAEVIHRRDVDRVIRTQTRRAYLVTRRGDRHFTVEPSRGALKTLLRDADDGTFLHYEKIEIPWQQAERLIRDGQAVGVGILHFGMVMVTVKDGGTFFTIPPGGEHVGKVLREASPPIEPTIE